MYKPRRRGSGDPTGKHGGKCFVVQKLESLWLELNIKFQKDDE